MLDFVSNYSERFDDLVDKSTIDLLNRERSGEVLVEYIHNICKEVERAIPNKAIRYKGYSRDINQVRIDSINRGRQKRKTRKKKSNERYVSIDKTFAWPYIFKFQTKFNDEYRDQRIIINIPLICDEGGRYLIKGNKYSAPIQLIDSVTYTGKGDVVIIKSLIRALKLKRHKVVLKDITGVTYSSYNFSLPLAKKKKIPFLLYYLAYSINSMTSTLRYFGIEDIINFYKKTYVPGPNEICFKFGTMLLGVDREKFENEYIVKQFVASLLDLHRLSITPDTINEKGYWINYLGAYMNVNRSYDKGIDLLRTFITGIDYMTLDTIKKLIGGGPKLTTHAVIRWMFLRYSSLLSKSPSVLNKRMRIAEYLISPFTENIYNKIYRYLQTPLKQRDHDRLNEIFAIPPNIIIDSIIGKRRTAGKKGLNIVKFSSRVNDLTLFTDTFKYTIAGPSSPFEYSKNSVVADGFKEFNESFVGRICLITASQGDPGITGVINPSARINPSTLTFKRGNED